MSGVVIRCPNCGTTQALLGECDACHEAETRYFCPNHSPGRWLDEPSCAQCGARVGVPPVTRRPPPSPTPPPRSSPRSEPPRPRADPPARRRGRPMPPDEPEELSEIERLPDEVWTGPVRTPRRPEFDFGGTFEPRERGGGVVPPDFAPVAIKIFSAFGCLRRIIMIAIILFILAMVAFFSMFGVGGLLYGAADSVPSIAQIHSAAGTFLQAWRALSNQAAA